ncbi:MAG: chorismate mutase [Actinobacteria bacterium]|nr:chorismate mutase [Actinomycetota bacterium]
MSTTPQDDPVIRQFRDQISDNDLKIVDAINKRLKLVTQLHDYKAEHDIDFVDPDREAWMLTYVSRANKGPLSGEGLREIYDHLLSLTKAEVLRLRGD